MLRTILAAATAIPLLLGFGAYSAAAEDGVPEPPRNRLSPTDDTELPQRTTPPLAPPQRLIPRRINELHVTEPQPPTTTPTPAKPIQAKPQRAATPRVVTRQAKPQRITARGATAQRRVVARTQRQEDTSLGTLFTATPPGLSPQAPPATMTYNYFGTAPAYSYAPGTPALARDGAPCPTRSRTSLSALFACTLR